MKKITLILILFSAAFSIAQQKEYIIDWEVKELGIEDDEITVPGFDSKYFDYSFEQGIKFSAHWEDSRPVVESSLKIRDQRYENISKAQLLDLDITLVKSNHSPKLLSATARGKVVNGISLNPIIKQDGQYKRLTAFTIQYTYQNNSLSSHFQQTSRSTARTNSVLASGEWFKFYVERSGVYRLSRDFISALGMDVANVNPRTIKIYGNGGSPIPLRNQDVQYYDVTENAIQVVGEQDGSFDSGDHVLFYAEAEDKFSEDYGTHINPYTDRTYYYITASGNAGKRIPPATEAVGIPQNTYTTFDDHQYVEEDLVNIAKIGRRWFGDIFSIENTKTYEFTFPNIDVSQPITITANPAAVSTSATSMQFNVSSGGQSTEGALQFNIPALPTSNNFILARDDGIRSNADVPVGNDLVTVEAVYDNAGNPSSVAYLDYLIVEAKRQLRGIGQQFPFRIEDMATNLGTAEVVLSNAAPISSVWDVTDIHNVVSYDNTLSEGTFSFNVVQGVVRDYVAIDTSDFLEPLQDSDARVDNQDIKGTVFRNGGAEADVDYLIFTSAELLSAAQRLADFHRQNSGLEVRVYDIQDVYDEFNTGNPDIGALRNLVKYVYDNASSPEDRLRYVCFFGDTSYDPKNRIPDNNDVVPTFHTYQSYSLTSAVMSDDYYGMMDANEGFLENAPDLLDLAVGRILADDLSMANRMVDKVIDYHAEASQARWRNDVILLSDDADIPSDTQIVTQLDALGDDLAANKPSFNVRKVYIDAFQQESSSGGFRYPGANQRFLNEVERGGLVINYFGHGGEDGLAAERIFQKPDAQGLFNRFRYPLFITVTCEFTRFDNPERPTAGEFTFWNETGGAIGLITTTRQIFVSVGINLNDDISRNLFRYDLPGTDNNYVSVAEALRRAKLDLGFIGSNQKRVVFFVGDPALKIAIPRPRINLTHVNDVPVEQALDTLKALSRAKIRGNIVDESGTLVPNFNGTVFSNIFDKNIQRQTLANDGTVLNDVVFIHDFETLGETIFRGKTSVDPSDSSFEFEFVVPRDIVIPVGQGRASFYATQEGSDIDYGGADLRFLVGELDENAPEDDIGPTIQLFMNDENFVSGGITNDSPILLGILEDENGINTASGIGHDILAILDGDETNPFVLNDYYEAELDDFTTGRVTFPFRDLEPGLHTLTLTAWDVYNNSATAELQFVVVGGDELELERVLNYPNPFTSYTEFWFNHNRPFEPLDVQVQVFTISGKVVWTRNQQITTDGFLSRDITWDGRDDFGDRIGKGVYVYKITVKSTLTNKVAEKIEKLVIL